MVMVGWYDWTVWDGMGWYDWMVWDGMGWYGMVWDGRSDGRSDWNWSGGG